jgi:hypothetical protein
MRLTSRGTKCPAKLGTSTMGLKWEPEGFHFFVLALGKMKNESGITKNC